MAAHRARTCGTYLRLSIVKICDSGQPSVVERVGKYGSRTLPRGLSIGDCFLDITNDRLVVDTN